MPIDLATIPRRLRRTPIRGTFIEMFRVASYVAALLAACGPLPCRHPELRATIVATADPPADGPWYAALPVHDGVLVAGAGGRILRAGRVGYADEKFLRYQEVVLDTGSTASLRGLAQESAYLPDLFAVGDAGTIRRSADFGASWTGVDSGTTADLESVAISAYGVGEGNLVIVAVGDGVALRSLDGGDTWQPGMVPAGVRLHGVGAYVEAIGPNAARVTWLAVGDDGVILRATDDASTWAPTASPTDRHLRRIDTDWSEPIWIAGDDGVVLTAVRDEPFQVIDASIPGEVADAREWLLAMRDGRVARATGLGGNATYELAVLDEPLPPLIAVFDPSYVGHIVLAEDGRFFQLEFATYDTRTDAICDLPRQ